MDTSLEGTSLDRIAEEQAALRRVALLVARAASPDEVFAAVSEETGRVLGSDSTGIFRYNDDETATVVARWGENEETVLPVGFVIPLARRRDDAARPCRSASPL